MAKFRVTIRAEKVELVEADNPYQAAAVASTRYDGGTQIVNVTEARGRAAAAPTKAHASKKRRLSPEARAKLAQNAAKARAARAKKLKAAKKSATKRSSGR